MGTNCGAQRAEQFPTLEIILELLQTCISVYVLILLLQLRMKNDFRICLL